MESLDITSKGIVGNEIADKIYHVRESKAVFAYRVEIYAQWEKVIRLNSL
ncbi:hypothetical protein [uncultured Helicobacter sp.]|nr:hypothetical protein [uncultured Helicobacter sp.]